MKERKRFLIKLLSGALALTATFALGSCSEEYLQYRLSEDGTCYSVTGIGKRTKTKVVIPSTYQGLPVTSIGDKAFYNCTNLTSVYYKGTAEGWAEISVDWYNDCLTDATRYYGWGLLERITFFWENFVFFKLF